MKNIREQALYISDRTNVFKENSLWNSIYDIIHSSVNQDALDIVIENCQPKVEDVVIRQLRGRISDTLYMECILL